MSIADSEGSISRRSRQVRQTFVGIIKHLSTIENQPPSAQKEGDTSSSEVEDALGKFDLWAGNLGTLRAADSRLSLDHRLAVDPEIRGQICVDLDELLETLDELMSALQNGDADKPGGDMGEEANKGAAGEPDGHEEIDPGCFEKPDPDDTNGEELEQFEQADTINEARLLLEVINEYLRSLFRVGMLVRNTSTRDRFDHALQVSTEMFADFADIDYLRHKSPKLCRDDNPWLLKRLGTSNAKRRQVLKYYRNHKDRLAANGVHDQDVAPTLLRSSKATTFVPQPRQLADFGEDDEDDAVSLASVSTMSSALAALRLPRLSELSPEGEPFECPICFVLQSFKKEKSWKSHAFRDLKAYTCTASQQCKDLFFSDRNSWFEHELRYHRSTYKCVLCKGMSLPTYGDLEGHFLQEHIDLPKDQTPGFIEQGRLPVKYHSAQDCPFCDDWADHIQAKQDPKGKGAERLGCDVRVSGSRFRRHVAAHLEQLAIFAMPRAIEDHDLDGEQASGVGSVRSTVGAEQDSQADWSEDEPLAAFDPISLPFQWEDSASGSTGNLAVEVDTPFIKLASVLPPPVIENDHRDYYLNDGSNPDNTTLSKGTQNNITNGVPSLGDLSQNSVVRRRFSSDQSLHSIFERRMKRASRSPSPPGTTGRNRKAANDGGALNKDGDNKKDDDITGHMTQDEADVFQSRKTETVEEESFDDSAGSAAAYRAITCGACRHNKVKCDGQMPCKSCKDANRDCNYVPYTEWPPFEESEPTLEDVLHRKRSNKAAIEQYKVRFERRLKEKLAGKQEDAEHERNLQQGIDKALPTYTRFARRHLSIETLNAYHIDFDYDQDPDYVLVKRWVPKDEQDQLWRHTRIIREKRELSGIYNVDDKTAAIEDQAS